MVDPHVRDMLARHFPDLYREVVAEPDLAPSGDWVARSQAFALFEPIRSAAVFLRDSLRRRGLDGGRDLGRYDLEGLLMEAVDRVVDVYGLGETLTTAELTSSLAAFVEQMEQANGREPDAEWCRRVAGEALEVLLNRRRREEDIVEGPNCAYFHRHLVPGAPPRIHPYSFLLLEESTEGGRRIVQARQEAVMFTVRMLDFDLEEMGEVLEDLLERQMKRGNFGGACRTAEQGRQVANGYGAQIRALLVEARRQPLSTGYRTRLAPILERAREHLAERTRRERDLRNLMERLRWEATPKVHDALDLIEEQIEASSHVYVALVRAIAEAPCEHQAQRARAFAGRVAPGTYPDPLDGVLLPALRLGAPALEAGAAALVRRLMPPLRPRLFDLPRLVASAFRPEPARRELDPSEEGALVRELPQPALPLEAAERLVRARVAAAPAGAWLSDLLAAAEGDRALETAIGLLVHGWRKRAGEEPEAALELRVVEVGPRVTRDGLAFDDLRVTGAAAARRTAARGASEAREEVGHAV